MFARDYFAESYFAPTYYPLGSDDVVVIPEFGCVCISDAAAFNVTISDEAAFNIEITDLTCNC